MCLLFEPLDSKDNSQNQSARCAVVLAIIPPLEYLKFAEIPLFAVLKIAEILLFAVLKFALREIM